MSIQRLPDHTPRLFLKRTISAQLHLLGAVIALIGLFKLTSVTLPLPESKHFWACLAYGIPAVLLFGASATYHFLSDGFHIAPRLRKWLRHFDHFSIYLFIAGSYTPFIVNALSANTQGAWLALIWGTAIVGIAYTAFKTRLPQWAQHRFVYTGIFLVMGWIAAFLMDDIFHNLSRQGIVFIIAGGVAYSIGAAIYASKRPRLAVGVFGFHELWHIMVMLGFAFHYLMILDFYQPF